ncbi:SDR family oxidoreductase [Nonomuraea soli]|uniref:NAD(P)-dependent dehydrogenase (Short-subunit alcohol dehydrogenase family) n=1 Tax=Nonomuraea soli TaxID=1032476 RepID=A0A7W0CD39_9ACTN|nr:SDR family oxidoreductase [Nonomuraea soli]MBA2888797.1 NAD(P)-dependent dehydrogenase (short-subunit alcohol dehydrogenase family) [Nonomuraea soli]
MSHDFTGKVVLITGGTKGIGAGIARAFLEAGATVIVCARKEPGAPIRTWLSGTEHPWRTAQFVQADVREPSDVTRLIAGLPGLDVLVNNAGGSPPAPVDGTSPRLHARVIELNLVAPLLVSQAAYPLLAASRGSIVMIGSISGSRPSPGTAAYGAAKAGLHHLAACLAAEWAPAVRVNTVVVGLAETEGAAEHYPPGVTGAIPAGRLARPEDVADACLWLAAPGYVTGAEILLHGGGETPAWRAAEGRDTPGGGDHREA